MKNPKGNARSRHHRRRHPPGTSPGTVTVDPQARPSRVRVLSYGPDRVREDEPAPLTLLGERVGQDPVTWVQVEGLGDAATLSAVASIFHLHSLAMEDVVNVGQRPKVDEYEDHSCIFIRMPRTGTGAQTEQLALVLGPGFLITFQEDPGDCLDPVRQRIRRGGGRIRGLGSDYLAYAILDAVVDAYFPVLEAHSEVLIDLEQRLFSGAGPVAPAEIYHVNRNLLTLRGSVRPLREMLGALLRTESPLVGEKTRIFLRDCYDHAVELLELHEVNRELGAGLIDLYRANLNIRLNEIMKVLTIISTIFIPITFIAGIYGMNFQHMPELRWAWGYPFSLGLMAAVTVGMLGYFRRKNWLG